MRGGRPAPIRNGLPPGCGRVLGHVEVAEAEHLDVHGRDHAAEVEGERGRPREDVDPELADVLVGWPARTAGGVAHRGRLQAGRVKGRVRARPAGAGDYGA